MKTEIDNNKSMVGELRKIRDKINAEIQDMTHEQLMQYFDQQETLHSKEFWKKKLGDQQKEK